MQHWETDMIARCSCGKVECEAAGTPIVSVACFCDDCQEGSRQIEALPGAPLLRGADGGTPYVLYRKDRFRCSRGGELLRELRLREGSPTKRVVASCCNSGMYVDFEKGHWLSIYRGRFVGADVPVQMHIQTRFKPKDMRDSGEVPSYASFPFSLLAKLVFARLAMLLHPTLTSSRSVPRER